MATITAAASPYHGQLVANQVDVVTLDQPYATIEVVNWESSTADVWFTVDRGVTDQQTVTPVIGAAGSNRCGPAGANTVPDDSFAINQRPSRVRLVSSGTPSYTIIGS